MSRLQDTLLTDSAYTRGSSAPMINLNRGQMAFANDYRAWVQNAAHVRQNLIPLVLEAPRALDYLPDEKYYWLTAFRTIMEEMAIRIQGLNAGYEVSIDNSNRIGGGGQLQHELTKVREVISNPSFQWQDKYNQAIAKFWRRYIWMFMGDPNSDVPGIVTLPGVEINDWLPDNYTFSMAFIEPDRTHRHVVNAWIMSNMMPDKSGDIIGSRDKGGDGELTTVDINFNGFAQTGDGVNQVCQELLNEIRITGASPFQRRGFIDRIQGQLADIRAGYARSAERVSEAQMQM